MQLPRRVELQEPVCENLRGSGLTVELTRRATDPGRAALHTGRNHTGPQFPHIHSHEISLQALGGNQLHIISNYVFVNWDRIGLFNELFVSHLQFLIKACCIITTNCCKWPSFLVKRGAKHTWYLLREPRVYPCKFFLSGVNFYRFNAKNWRFLQI